MEEPIQVPTLSQSEFLPRLSPWAIAGGGVLLMVFGAAVVLATVLKYNVTVKAPGTVRPAGELRLVQSAIEGTIKEIAVKENQKVKAGDIVARMDDSRLMTTKSQLEGDLRQGRLQLNQINAQIQSLDSQLAAESNVTDRSIQAAEAQLRSQQRLFQDQQTTAQSNVQEARASLNLAQEEFRRFRQLAASGAVATLTLKEKEAAVQVAQAKVDRASSALNPTDAEIARAQEQIAQIQAKGASTLATLRQQREQLLQNRIELQRQLDRTAKESQQIERSFDQSVVRAPIAGTVLQLNLRNADQVVRSGEAIAFIAPENAPFVLKAQIAAQDIDKVKLGQSIQMRVSACPFPDYGTLNGVIKTVAPDARPAAENAPATYEVTMEPARSFVGNERRQCPLQAGMEGSVDVISRQETVVQFLMRKTRLISNL
ncbi:HlyD family efflux transporter periplasmic adaptor subunit [Leptolyngbya sp. NIES-2104]|uniref:HlyD family efflux transporter periplasmic adaptor subunit n=1 Tax=Leptolyngbya sp. NIES-2104 TaxID=1552121 RepID=UPI0006EC7503|nr:HlyD family efflux transporter periplasmic adaptor subunit [Leptolyngbya sp. NIES-2104]GAP98890.1 HlyD family secretion protein [Leptolyngbya sp. NIES-2104]